MCVICSSRPFARHNGFAAISRAAAKSAAARLRSLGVLRTNIDWTQRAEACERCPMRVISNKITYCGSPFLQKPIRDETTEGCGCPTLAKAKDPTEHCPPHRAASARDPDRRHLHVQMVPTGPTANPGPDHSLLT